MAEGGGFEPPVPVSQYDSLANCWFQPLTHLSNIVFLFKRTLSSFGIAKILQVFKLQSYYRKN